jgi:hypothetical protein
MVQNLVLILAFLVSNHRDCAYGMGPCSIPRGGSVERIAEHLFNEGADPTVQVVVPFGVPDPQVRPMMCPTFRAIYSHWKNEKGMVNA